MITYAIAAARSSGLFSRVIVSTDDDEIASIALAEGAELPFRRPAALADDHTPTVPVVAHALRELASGGDTVDLACCIYPCVPFLRSSDLADALSLLGDDVHYVYPVCRFHDTPWRAMTRGHDGQMSFVFPQFELTRSQDLPTCFHDAGQFYWGRATAWMQGLPMHSHGIGWLADETRVVDIDTEDDWRKAERIADDIGA